MDNEALINAYFGGNLSESQRREFDRLLQTDTEFAADFEFESQLQSALKKEERQEIKSLFSNLENETIVEVQAEKPTRNKTGSAFDSEETVSKKIETINDSNDTGAIKIGSKETETKVISIRPWLAAASVVLLLGLSSWFLFFNSPDLNTDQLYAANFAPYENVVHPIERGEQLEDLKTRAFAAYEDADYSLALELFKELQTQQADPYISFYEAIVLMQLNKQQEAIPLLEDYIENDGQLRDRAIWYLALAYLKLDDIAESKLQLEQLIRNDRFKSDAAKNLLEALE